MIDGPRSSANSTNYSKARCVSTNRIHCRSYDELPHIPHVLSGARRRLEKNHPTPNCLWLARNAGSRAGRRRRAATDRSHSPHLAPHASASRAVAGAVRVTLGGRRDLRPVVYPQSALLEPLAPAGARARVLRFSVQPWPTVHHPASSRALPRCRSSLRLGSPGNPDQRMPAIAARVTSIYYHVPSLVDHESVPTTWGGIEHSARDFDPQWRAS
jgi:hypothetical protein